MKKDEMSVRHDPFEIEQREWKTEANEGTAKTDVDDCFAYFSAFTVGIPVEDGNDRYPLFSTAICHRRHIF